MTPPMKKLIIILAILGGSFATLSAQTDSQAYRMARKGSNFNVGLNLNLDTIDVKSNRMVVLTPMVVAGADTVNLSSVGLLGRRRYFYYERNEKRYPEVFENENYRKSTSPDTYSWNETMPFKKWMDGATLKLHKQVYGCCNDVIEDNIIDLRTFNDYHPVFKWIVPEAELMKVRALEGSAYIDFVVSTTDIRPNYRDNHRELGKIIGTIDSLKADADITMDTIHIKGYASPESPYENNTRLAKGRTQALKDYVSQLYKFDEDFILTSYEPEDWEGLRKYVAASNINNKEALLEIIDCDLEPDPKEMKIKTSYPKEYQFIKEVYYPALRHSDYKIVYKIKTFTDIEDLKMVFKESPAKLSLREFFNLSTAYQPGTEEFSQVFEVAALVYPDNETANLNAANAAMSVNDLEKAERYLNKSGNSPEAVYARGVLEALKQNYAKAKELFAEAAAMPDNASILEVAEKTKVEMDEFIN